MYVCTNLCVSSTLVPPIPPSAVMPFRALVQTPMFSVSPSAFSLSPIYSCSSKHQQLNLSSNLIQTNVSLSFSRISHPQRFRERLRCGGADDGGKDLGPVLCRAMPAFDHWVIFIFSSLAAPASGPSPEFLIWLASFIRTAKWRSMVRVIRMTH